MAIIALIAWWSCNAFIPTIASGLANAAAQSQGLGRAATLALVESWKTTATASFNLGGLIGTLLTIPIAKQMGRKPMFFIYFALSAASIFVAFGSNGHQVRLYLYFSSA
jgi:MFS family permease